MKKFIQNFARIINLIKPPRIFSWQTIILISIFFWIIAFLVGLGCNNLRLQNIFSILGCLAAIGGFGWFSLENPIIVQGFSLSTWIWVELVCLFVASWWLDIAPFIWMIWPALSAIFAAWPEFFAVQRKIKNLVNEQRFKLLIWILSHLVISCWIQFSLIIQDWVLQYPSLLADDLSQSDFIVKIQPFSRSISGGEKVLNDMERQVKTQIDGKIWVVVESWLKNTNQQDKLLTEAKKQISGIAEKHLWKFRTEVKAQKTGYNLLMIAEWQGPSYNPQGYLLKKVCQVNAVTRQPTPVNTKLRQVKRNNNASRVATTPQVRITVKPVKVANVQCQSVIKQIIEQNQLTSFPKL